LENLFGGISGNETLSLPREPHNRQTNSGAKASSSRRESTVASVLLCPKRHIPARVNTDITHFSIQDGSIELFGPYKSAFISVICGAVWGVVRILFACF